MADKMQPIKVLIYEEPTEYNHSGVFEGIEKTYTYNSSLDLWEAKTVIYDDKT